MKTIHASGSRKSAIARATLMPGNGIVRFNSRLLQTVEPNICRAKLEEPLILAGDSAKTVDINVIARGGGPNSQADACRLAIARVLALFDRRLRQVFLEYDRNLLVADARQKEVHKPLHHGKARAKRQLSKR